MPVWWKKKGTEKSTLLKSLIFCQCRKNAQGFLKEVYVFMYIKAVLNKGC